MTNCHNSAKFTKAESIFIFLRGLDIASNFMARWPTKTEEAMLQIIMNAIGDEKKLTGATCAQIRFEFLVEKFHPQIQYSSFIHDHDVHQSGSNHSVWQQKHTFRSKFAAFHENAFFVTEIFFVWFSIKKTPSLSIRPYGSPQFTPFNISIEISETLNENSNNSK